MTKKSIETILEDHDREKRLIRFLPVMDADQKDVRTIFMPRPLHDWCYQSDSKKTRDYKANIRAFLKRFVVGGEVDNHDYMKSWRSDVFEFRVQLQPKKENTRIFGAFIKQDHFVAFHRPYLRSEFGGKTDPKWDKAIEKALEHFRELFPGHVPVRARPFAGCVSGKFYDTQA